MKRMWLMLVGSMFFWFSMYGFVGPSLEEGWGMGGFWYKLRAYPEDFAVAERLFSQFRFLSWMMLPSWGSMPVESLFLWAGPYVYMEHMANVLFRFDGAVGGVAWGLFGFDGNFVDKDGDGERDDDSFWGTSLAVGPRFRYSREGWMWQVSYVPVYRFFAKAEKTEIPMPKNYWTHTGDVMLRFDTDEYGKWSVIGNYTVYVRDKEYVWGYNGRERIPAFDQQVGVRVLGRIPLENISSVVRLGGGLFWREKESIMFGTSAQVYQEEMTREVRGYAEEDVLSRFGVLAQASYRWNVLQAFGFELGVDTLYYDNGRQWEWLGGAGFTVHWKWNQQQAFVVEYNYPFVELRPNQRYGMIVMGFVWIFGGEQ